jgi:hypothetical protein
MFKEHTEHGQSSLFGVQQQLSEARQDELTNSKEAVFYDLVFREIPESEFADLYSDSGSRPNTPVNQLVGAEILKHTHGWTDEALMDHVRFDLKTRYALGMVDVAEEAFCERTLYYFREKLEAYERETGINLLERVFDHLTDQQLETLDVKTGIQRMDSFQAMSNIRSYTRLQLVIEVLQRLWRVVNEEDQSEWESRVTDYVESDSGTILYTMDPDEYEHALHELGELYRDLHDELKEAYGDTEAFGVFERVFAEQFEVNAQSVRVRDDDEMDSDSLQSPDDEDATYRHKNGEQYRGQSVHAKETCDPDNDLQMINDVFVTANNVDDSVGLNQRLNERPSGYEEMDRLFVDGGYGSPTNDQDLEDMGIDMVQTGIRGRPPDVEFEFDPLDSTKWDVSCPNQTVTSESTRTRHKAVFDETICEECPLRNTCPTQSQQQGRVLYFDEQRVQRQKRHQRLHQLPEDHQTLRNNVEATMKEFTVGMNHKGKLRSRGRFKAVMYAICTAIGINLGRIHRHLEDQEGPDTVWEALKEYMGDLGAMLLNIVNGTTKSRLQPQYGGIC